MVAEVVDPDRKPGIFGQRLIIPAAQLFDNASSDGEIGAGDRGDFEPFPSPALCHPLKTNRFDVNKFCEQCFRRIDDAEFSHHRSGFLIIHEPEDKVINSHFFRRVVGVIYTNDVPV